MNASQLRQRGHARTNYEPHEIAQAYREAEDLEEEGEVRELLKSIDGGRFYEFLDSAHNVLARSDLKRRREFVDNYSDHLIRWIKAFGEVEDLSTFPDIEVGE